MILHPNPIFSTRFTWVPDDRRFVAEASDIGPFGRVYDDACDVGLTLVSRYDGRELVFVVEHEQRDGEGEVLYWDLERAQGRAPFGIRVYND